MDLIPLVLIIQQLQNPITQNLKVREFALFSYTQYVLPYTLIHKNTFFQGAPVKKILKKIYGLLISFLGINITSLQKQIYLDFRKQISPCSTF